jgi:hypothetical protein
VQLRFSRPYEETNIAEARDGWGVPRVTQRLNRTHDSRGALVGGGQKVSAARLWFQRSRYSSCLTYRDGFSSMFHSASEAAGGGQRRRFYVWRALLETGGRATEAGKAGEAKEPVVDSLSRPPRPQYERLARVFEIEASGCVEHTKRAASYFSKCTPSLSSCSSGI